MTPEERICLARWPETHGQPVCPKCGHDKPYDISEPHRRRWRCWLCAMGDFSPTSGTALASRKMPLETYLAMIDAFAAGANALRISQDLQLQYKTVFVFCRKLRDVANQVTDSTDPDQWLAALLHAPVSRWKGYWQNPRLTRSAC